MSPEDRDLITTSLADLWSFQTIVISNLLYAMRQEGFSKERIETMLQNMDRHVDALQTEPNQKLATSTLATVRQMLANAPD